ncbi:hypothetical protein FKM82_030060 [Ascaphus truei]
MEGGMGIPLTRFTLCASFHIRILQLYQSAGSTQRRRDHTVSSIQVCLIALLIYWHEDYIQLSALGGVFPVYRRRTSHYCQHRQYLAALSPKNRQTCIPPYLSPEDRRSNYLHSSQTSHSLSY